MFVFASRNCTVPEQGKSRIADKTDGGALTKLRCMEGNEICGLSALF